MLRRNLILVLLIGFCGHFALASPCEVSQESFLKHEKELREIAKSLGEESKSSNFLTQSEHALKCVLFIQHKSQGFLKGVVNRFVYGLLRGSAPAGLDGDISYELVGKLLQKAVQQEESLFSSPLFLMLGEANWSTHKPFCRDFSSYVCMGFLQKNENILGQSQLEGALSVASFLRAKKYLSAREQDELHKQLLDLETKVSPKKKILLRVVRETLRHFEKKKLKPLSKNFLA